MRLRRFGVGITAIVLGVLAGPAGALASPAPTDLTAEVTSGKSRYLADETVSLGITVRNTSDVACELFTQPDGAVRIVGMKRDGTPVAPSYGHARYVDGYRRLLEANRATVGPGETQALPLDAVPLATMDDGQALPVIEPTPTNGGLAALWPVGAAGEYEVTLTYQVPGPAGAQKCAGATAPVTVRFAVGDGPGGIARWPGLVPVLVIAVAAAAGLTLLIVVLSVLRRGRRNRVGPTGPAVLMLAALAAGTLVAVDAQPAAAKILPAEDGLQPAVKNCLGQIRAVGGESAKVVDYLEAENGPVVAIKKVTEKRANGIWNMEAYPLDPRSEGRVGSVIYWNPDVAGMRFNDGVPVDDCAALLHELVHAYANADYSNDMRRCSIGYGISVEEARATLAENTYRAAKGLPQRTTHGTDKVPPNLNECQPSGPSRKIFKTPGVHCFGVDAKRCAITNGDPHLTTFDGYRYDLQAVGEFVAAVSTSGDLQVQTRQTAVTGSRTVSVNSAVAVGVGKDRVSLYQTGAALTLRINGVAADVGLDQPARLPGGGVVTAIEASNPAYGFGYTVAAPDGSTVWVDPIGGWGLVVFTALSPDRQGKMRGLFGNFDGDQSNDLVSAGGKALSDPSFDQLYREFGESWRVTQSGSLFDYDDGQDTTTFTDRTFPDKAITLADIGAAERARAREVCVMLGVADPVMLDACTLDVALTGQPAFAVATAAVQGAAADPDATTPQGGTTVAPGGVLRDGDTAVGELTSPGQVVRYSLELGNATVVRLYDAPDKLRVSLAGPPAPDNEIPGFTVTSNNQWRVRPGGSYQLEVSYPDNATGRYSFRLVTAKERRIAARLGDQVTGRLEVPGRVDLYQLTVDAETKITLSGASPCDEDFAVAIVDDVPAPRVYSPAGLCYGISLGTLLPGKPYLLVLWSPGGRTGDYTFQLQR
jgi:hypothetical protein